MDAGLHPELDGIVGRLAEQGIRAAVDYIRQEHLGMVGLRIRDDFFPLWELHARMNRRDLDHLDFAAIKKRRRPGWSPFGPSDVRVLFEG
jgi:hypothetical protein